MGERPPEPATTAADPGRRLGAWGYAAVVTIATRVAFFLVAYAASWFLSEGQGEPAGGFFEGWSHWDARLLLLVGEHGYTDPATDPHATAFFPLFPLLVAGLSTLGMPPLGAGLLISTVATVVALAFLYRLADEEIGAGAGRRAALYLALFPTAVFLVAPYTEALFLAGAIPAFYYARRGRWGHVALPAAVAMGARFAGAFLLFGLTFELLRADSRPRRLVQAGGALLAGAIPLVLYAAYLAQVKGNPLYFVVDQREGWQRRLTNPIAAFTRSWDMSQGTHYPSDWIFAWRLEVMAAVIGVGLVILALWLREWGYAAFMGSMMIVLLSSTWYFSIPRMLLTLFPAVIFLARGTHRKPELHEIAVMTLAPLATLGVVVFTSGAWFF